MKIHKHSVIDHNEFTILAHGCNDDTVINMYRNRFMIELNSMKYANQFITVLLQNADRFKGLVCYFYPDEDAIFIRTNNNSDTVPVQGPNLLYIMFEHISDRNLLESLIVETKLKT